MNRWIVPQDRRRETPNQYVREEVANLPVECVVLHYTVTGKGLPGRVPYAVRWLCDPDAKASAHFVVDGSSVWQLAELGARTWHAGGSRWRGAGNVNRRSIGVEIANWGLLFQRPAGNLVSYYDRAFNGVPFKISVSAFRALYGDDALDEVRRLYAMKGLQTPTVLSFEEYGADQVRLVAELLEELARIFPVLREGGDRLTTHQEIDPTRKLDPGPALNWRVQQWRHELAAGLPLSYPGSLAG